MRAVLLFFLLVVVAVIGYFAAVKAGFLPPLGADRSTTIEEPIVKREPAPQEKARSLPRFDIVRVDRSGYAVIAGEALPGSEVTLYANGDELETFPAERDGTWVINTETPLKAGPVELTLSMKTADGEVITSEETVVVYVPEREGDKPLILRTTPGGASEVLQSPTDPDVSLGPLALETIDYDSEGNVIFAGRATPGSTVQVFTNQNFVGEAVALGSGRWTLEAVIQPGRYTLQVIQLDEFGKPAYALEVPFERAAYSDVQFKDGNVVVQPGNSLWRISRRVYGKGARYTVIYEANKSQIRDPDLIYPGQIFKVPDEEKDEDSEE
jgi:nucleoid-associated protein YgaU